jgi:hypothetical protein
VKFNRSKKNIWPISFLISVGGIFFYKFFFHGLLPLPLDIITGMYFPWLNHKWGNAVGVAVKNHLISDSVSQFWVWRNWAVDFLKQGKIAIWNPHSLAGYPLSPWFHTMIFSPINLIYFIFDKPTSMAIIVILQVFIGLIGTYVFVEEILKNKLSAVLSSVLFVFSAFFIGWLTWGTISWTVAFLPWILYFLEKNKPIGVFVSLLMSFLGGHPQTFLYVFIISAVYLGVNKIWPQIKTLVFFIGATSMAVLPSLQILSKSIRGAEDYLSGVNFGLLSWPKLITLVFAPNFFGNPATLNYWGKGFNFQEKLVWFGSVGLSLCLFYLFSNKKLNKLRPFIYLFFGGIILSTKYPLGILIYKLNTPLLSSGSAGRALILSAFSGSVLAGGGLKLVLNGEINWKQIRRLLLVLAGISGGLIIGLGYVWYVTNYQVNPAEINIINAIIANAKVGFRNLIIPIFSSLVVLAGLVLAKVISHKKVSYFMGFSLIILAVGEGVYFGWKYTPFSNKKYYFPETEITSYLDQQKKDGVFFRIEREKGELMPPNMWMAYGLNSTAGYQPVYPRAYADWMKTNQIIGDYSRYVEWERSKDFFDQMGVKYFLILKRDEQGRVTDQGNLPYWLDQQTWQEVESEGPVVILENSNYSPPYFLKNGNGKVELISKENDYWSFKVKADEEDILIVKENYFPGWKAVVNGQPVDINIESGTFKAVAVPAGQSQVELYYQNTLLSVGMYMSLASILWFLFVIIKQKQ